MKFTVVGASGLIGTRLSEKLRWSGHDVAAASLSLGVDTVTGKGLDVVMAGTEVVVDVTNAASFGDSSALDFFKASTKNLLAAAAQAGIRHYLALSVVGTPRLVESDYFRAKMVQENLIRAAGRPYTILRSTQFYEFINGLIDIGAEGNIFRLPSALMRPVAAGMSLRSWRNWQLVLPWAMSSKSAARSSSASMKSPGSISPRMKTNGR